MPPDAARSARVAAPTNCPIPLNEEARLDALYGLRILDTPPDERFQRIVRLAAGHFGTPMARITFVDRDRTWYKACVGAPAVQGPREIAICSQTVMSDDVQVARDLSRDPRFRHLPQVVGDPKLRFYAGAPIVVDEGLRVGSLCIIDFAPRPGFSEDDSAFLADLAQIVVHELELHQQITSRDRSLAEAQQQVAIARGAKKRFMDVVSHELRTPLSHVLGFGKILAEEQLGTLGSETYADYARDLYTSAEHLEGLIKRVLTYASAESGELRLAEAEVTTEALMTKCLSLVQLRSKARKVEIALSIAGDAPAKIFADEVQIAETVVQLLDNAISFSPQGATVELAAGRAAGGEPSIRVLDRGPGLDRERAGDLMSPFAQGDQSLSRTHDGVGLGLPVARAIAELHGGTLRLAERPGGGTIAELLLPLRRAVG